MSYDKSLIAHKLQRWDQYITDYHLPQTRWCFCWSDISASSLR